MSITKLEHNDANIDRYKKEMVILNLYFVSVIYIKQKNLNILLLCNIFSKTTFNFISNFKKTVKHEFIK